MAGTIPVSWCIASHSQYTSLTRSLVTSPHTNGPNLVGTLSWCSANFDQQLHPFRSFVFVLRVSKLAVAQELISYKCSSSKRSQSKLSCPCPPTTQIKTYDTKGWLRTNARSISVNISMHLNLYQTVRDQIQLLPMCNDVAIVKKSGDAAPVLLGVSGGVGAVTACLKA
jgi:hypothetical protein